ncbi:MAG: M16 family metallopeptidase [Alphaproteobacteria bacterium]
MYRRFLEGRAVGFVVALLTLSFAAVPARGGLFNPETFTLSNGMQVVLVPDHRAPVVSHWVWYRGGAADEPVGKSGVAHFLEHLMFKGTPTVPQGEFSRIVARNGGTENAMTSQDYTAYFQSVARDRLELVMRLEADRMVNLMFSDEEVARERDVILEERRSRVDNEPSVQLFEMMNAVQFLAHPYGTPVIGWEHEIERLTAEDARAFYRRHYAPNNAYLIVVGDITAAELRPLAEKSYGAISAREIAPQIRPQEPPQRGARRVELRDKRVRQPEWRRSYLAPSLSAGASEHAYAFEVLAEVLSGTTGRLYRALVVEKKLALWAGAGYDGVNLDLSEFFLYAAPAPGVGIDDLEAALEEEIARLLTQGVDEDEVERVKRTMRADAVYARDSRYLAARVFGEGLTAGLTVEEVEAWPDRIQAVTVGAVNAAARFVFRPEASVTGVLLPGEPAS